MFEDLSVVQQLVDALLQAGAVVVRVVGESLAQLLVQIEKNAVAQVKLRTLQVKGLIELVDEVKEKLHDQRPVGDGLERSEREGEAIASTLIDVLQPLPRRFHARVEIDLLVEVIRNEATGQLRMQFAQEVDQLIARGFSMAREGRERDRRRVS